MTWYPIKGGKPEEEKTVTAGTAAVVVNPSSGKTMKKVTVNPTPSQTKTVTAGTGNVNVSPDSGKLLSKVTVAPTPTQSKSVTPSTSQQTVTPDAGKHLSSVVVRAVEDVTPEVTAQTGLIESIAKEFDVSITTPSGTNKKKLQTNNENLSKIKNGASTSVINGILEEYYSESETIDANTFVSFLDSIRNTKWDSLATDSTYVMALQAIKLSDSRVLLIGIGGAGSLVYGTVLNFAGTSVKIGTLTKANIWQVSLMTERLDPVYMKVSDSDVVFLAKSGSYVDPRNGLVYVWVSVGDDDSVSIVGRNTLDTDEVHALTNAVQLSSDTFMFLEKSYTNSKYYIYSYVVKINLSEKSISVVKKTELYVLDAYESLSYSRLVPLNGTRFCFYSARTTQTIVYHFDIDSKFNITPYSGLVIANTYTSYVMSASTMKKISDSLVMFISPTGGNDALYYDIHFVGIDSTAITLVNSVKKVFKTDQYTHYGRTTIGEYEDGTIKVYVTGGKSYNYAYEIELALDLGSFTASANHIKQIYASYNTSDEDIYPDAPSTSGLASYYSAKPYIAIPFTSNSVMLLCGVDSGSYVYSTFKIVRSRKSATKSTSVISGLTKNKLTESASGKVWKLKGV